MWNASKILIVFQMEHNTCPWKGYPENEIEDNSPG
jgi:hypothetical protein